MVAPDHLVQEQILRIDEGLWLWHVHHHRKRPGTGGPLLACELGLAGSARAGHCGPDGPFPELRSYGQVVLERRLLDALAELNPDLPSATLDNVLRELTHPAGSTLEALNREFHRMLIHGVTVEYRASDGTVSGVPAQVVDFDNPSNNDWLAVNQFSVTENSNTRRPDVMLFVNGLPLGIIELKNPVDEDATIWTA